MDKSGTSQATGGGEGLWLLTLLFIGLKLTGHIGWSWWWVLAPTWIPLAFALTAFALMGVFMLIALILRRRDRTKYRRKLEKRGVRGL